MRRRSCRSARSTSTTRTPGPRCTWPGPRRSCRCPRRRPGRRSPNPPSQPSRPAYPAAAGRELPRPQQSPDRVQRRGDMHVGMGVHAAGDGTRVFYDGHCRPFLRLRDGTHPLAVGPVNPGLLHRTGRSDRHAGGCHKSLGPGRRIDSRTTRAGVSRFAGQAGTQAPDPTPAPPQNHASRAEPLPTSSLPIRCASESARPAWQAHADGLVLWRAVRRTYLLAAEDVPGRLAGTALTAATLAWRSRALGGAAREQAAALNGRISTSMFSASGWCTRKRSSGSSSFRMGGMPRFSAAAIRARSISLPARLSASPFGPVVRSGVTRGTRSPLQVGPGPSSG